ncbi:MAG: HlyD family secretion protein [Schleiferiaceae bacterium]|jgi:HlyD family secretion protein|nr:HlyD family secretion protein [Schleiferiaceae bacterium]
MPTNKFDINLRSEEIQDLMVKKPSWMVRWGITTMFAIILLLLFFTWLIEYPDHIDGRINITPTKAPVKIVNQTSGKVTKLYITENVDVQKGTIIAQIENPISAEVINYLGEYLDEMDEAILNGGIEIPLPDTGNYNYGDLQSSVNQMRRDLREHNLKNNYNLQELAINKLKTRISNHKEMQAISANLLKIEKSELKNAEEKYLVDKALYEKGAMSKYDFLNSQSVYNQKQQQVERMQLSQVEYQITLNNMQVELASMEYNKDLDVQGDLENILAYRESIYNFIHTWKQQYAITAPVTGKLAFVQPLQENQYVHMNEVYFAVVQQDDDLIGWVDVTSDGYGKIKKGQMVNVRLNNYPFHEYGLLVGEVEKVGQIPVNGFYQVGISFPKGLTTTYNYQLDFSPELLGTAEIVTEKKRLIERFFDSFIKLLKRGHHTIPSNE